MKSVFQPTAMLLPRVFRATGTYSEKTPTPQFEFQGFIPAVVLSIFTN